MWQSQWQCRIKWKIFQSHGPIWQSPVTKKLVFTDWLWVIVRCWWEVLWKLLLMPQCPGNHMSIGKHFYSSTNWQKPSCVCFVLLIIKTCLQTLSSYSRSCSESVKSGTQTEGLFNFKVKFPTFEKLSVSLSYFCLKGKILKLQNSICSFSSFTAGLVISKYFQKNGKNWKTAGYCHYLLATKAITNRLLVRHPLCNWLNPLIAATSMNCWSVVENTFFP